MTDEVEIPEELRREISPQVREEDIKRWWDQSYRVYGGKTPREMWSGTEAERSQLLVVLRKPHAVPEEVREWVGTLMTQGQIQEWWNSSNDRGFKRWSLWCAEPGRYILRAEIESLRSAATTSTTND